MSDDRWLIDPNVSVAVELCAFRLCDWNTPDIRTTALADRDELIRAHLLDAHRRELTALGHLARDAGLIL